MQKHTPGPWTITKTGPASRYMIAGSESVAMTYGQGAQESDARLIAAAPELLAALQGLLNADAERNDCPGFASAGNWLRANEAARAVIAKVNA